MERLELEAAIVARNLACGVYGNRRVTIDCGTAERSKRFFDALKRNLEFLYGAAEGEGTKWVRRRFRPR
jgi:hypothetical protein